MDSTQSAWGMALDFLGDIQLRATILNLAGLWVLYKVALALYNISPLHPLYSFPGPRLAAMSYGYEAYYDFWLHGRYTWEIQRLHKQYGHIIRINPDELHCDDTRFLDEIYAGGNRVRDKWHHFVSTTGSGPVSTGTFATIPHEVHRRRRMAMARYFSRGQMLKLESEVYALSQRMADKMLGMKGRPFNIREAFDCFTADIISQYSFGADMGFVDQPDGWTPNLATWTADFFNAIYIMRHIPPMRVVALIAPLTANIMGGQLKSFMDQMTIVIPGYIEKAREEKENRRFFADLLESPQLPDEDKSVYRLTGEGFTLLTAGTETTSAALAGIAYYLLAQPATLDRLLEDLKDLDPADLKWTTLEQRPYLWAIIQEAVRLFPGISTRSARIARDETLVYHDDSSSSSKQKTTTQWTIPKGTPIGMTSTIQHHNEDIFPDSWAFRPERWLIPSSSSSSKETAGGSGGGSPPVMVPHHALERHLLAFGRGSRSCVGMQLALCELYVLTATLALRVLPRARLHETGEEDVRYDHDLTVPKPRAGSKGVRVVVVE